MQYWVDGLSDDPLTAATAFHAQVLPTVAMMLASVRTQDNPSLTLVFSPADHTHRGWRLAAVQSLARKHAPVRVNAIVSADDSAMAAAIAYLQSAHGVTGQYLPLDGTGTSDLLSE